ncbi:phosphoribosyl-AMP cyclohydrolase [Hirschia baltica]|uniref:Phosphoribosyl-AMP cyclohydrolase n=1 Tax=Hirschia baltica (strain ATCC 49814 / DSM 5838 / IFAM 1418) TaxID=582402 RepID=C6XNB8_HIRBI|nr:phosphoribosyl-AMP cyclohydrolase [Hirschia baltica]ACT60062.1 Phosphoribosyl-AMP cyclohydrolase [Hirschia baltica ATCC 49814]
MSQANKTPIFPPPLSGSEQDETTSFRPRFNSDGLVAAIAQDVSSNEVLMLAWMNEDALKLTIETGRAVYWSRSRNQLWRKGDTSGAYQYVESIHTDCDQDAILLKVRQTDGACHTGRVSCFYRQITDLSTLNPTEDKPA